MYFNYFYCDLYVKRDERLKLAADIVAGSITLICIVGWSLLSNLFILWALLIAVSQLTTLLADKIKPTQRVCALKYYVSELNSSLSEMSYTLREIQSGVLSNDSKINNLIKHFESEESKLNMKFIAPLYFPEKKSILKKADKRTNQFLEQINFLGDDHFAAKTNPPAPIES